MKFSLGLSSKISSYAWAWAWLMWPMIGIRFFVALLMFWAFKQPKKILLLINYPSFVQFVLWYFPHLLLGEWIWRAERLDYNLQQMWDYVSTDPWGSIVSLLPSILHAITGWVILSPLHFVTGYLAFWLWFRFVAKH